MVIEILSAIAWPTTMTRGRLERRSEDEMYRMLHNEGHGMIPGVLGKRRKVRKYEKEGNVVGEDKGEGRKGGKLRSSDLTEALGRLPDSAAARKVACCLNWRFLSL